MSYNAQRNKIIDRYDTRIQNLRIKKAEALKVLHERMVSKSSESAIACEYCSTSSLAPLWEFHFEYEYSECASRIAHSEPVGGWVPKTMLLGMLACPSCKRKSVLVEHPQRDHILEILQWTMVIKKMERN